MKFLVTGGAGFIGSNLTDFLLMQRHEVCVVDNFETGRKKFLEQAFDYSSFSLETLDIRDAQAIENIWRKFSPDWIVHLAANADVRFGLDRPRRDLDYNTIATWNVLDAARKSSCKNFLFSSTGSVYGEPEVFPTPEGAPFPVQTSLYGASKLAGEALIQAYAHGFGLQAVIFRFVSILGPRYTHGHIFDFLKKLKKDSSRLEVLGDGTQTKSYLHVTDLIEGIWNLIEGPRSGLEIINIGHEEALQVRESVDLIVRRLGLNPQIIFGLGSRGWVGDSPRIQLDTSRLRARGWSAQRSLQSAVFDTVDYLRENPFLLDEGGVL
ncbi:MAG: NAD-dependent epimerase/dehydratase family protein [Bdellovibrio sp.]